MGEGRAIHAEYRGLPASPQDGNQLILAQRLNNPGNYEPQMQGRLLKAQMSPMPLAHP